MDNNSFSGQTLLAFHHFHYKKFSLISNLNLPSSSLKSNCSDTSPKKQGKPSVALLLLAVSEAGWGSSQMKVQITLRDALGLSAAPKGSCCCPWGSTHSTAARALSWDSLGNAACSWGYNSSTALGLQHSSAAPAPRQGGAGDRPLMFALGVEFGLFQVAPGLKSILLDSPSLEAALQERA